MAVRDALLALLTPGPAYGFQVHGDLAARTGGRRSVNVGQTYATIERLTKQGLVEPAGATHDGLPLHRLTPDGHAAAQAWLGGADAAGADPWDETIDRVLIARSLPHWDADAVIAAEMAAWQARRAAAAVEAAVATASSDETAASADGADARADTTARADDAAARADAGEAALGRLAASADLARADAALAWLATVAGTPRVAFAPRATRPKRGRRPAAQASAMA